MTPPLAQVEYTLFLTREGRDNRRNQQQQGSGYRVVPPGDAYYDDGGSYGYDTRTSSFGWVGGFCFVRMVTN